MKFNVTDFETRQIIDLKTSPLRLRNSASAQRLIRPEHILMVDQEDIVLNLQIEIDEMSKKLEQSTKELGKVHNEKMHLLKALNEHKDGG